MKAFENRMVKRLGYMKMAQKEVRQEFLNSEPCVVCGGGPTLRTRLISYRELRSLGFSDAWLEDSAFFVDLCRMCNMLWYQRYGAWRKEYMHSHGVTARVAERRREGAYLDLVEKLGERIRQAQEVKQEYSEKIVGIDIAVGMPFDDGLVSYIDATRLRQGSVTVFVVREE